MKVVCDLGLSLALLLTLGDETVCVEHPNTVSNPDSISLFVFQSSLQCSPWGLMASLEQQVGELRVNTADNAVEPPTDVVDYRPRSGNITLHKLDP